MHLFKLLSAVYFFKSFVSLVSSCFQSRNLIDSSELQRMLDTNMGYFVEGKTQIHLDKKTSVNQSSFLSINRELIPENVVLQL